MASSNELTFAQTVRSTGPSPRTAGALETPRGFLDFVVDGEPLYPVIRQLGFDLVTPFWHGLDPALIDVTIEQLRGTRRGDAPGGRVALYVCPECGDLGCGAMTVDLVVDRDTVTWRRWGYQNDSDGEFHETGSSALPVFTFERARYDAAVAAVQSRRER